MNEIPQELVDRISSYLDRADLKNTLLISRKFQSAAERYSTAFQSYVLTESNARVFSERYSSRRFRYLRYLHYYTHFPKLDSNDKEENCRESLEELELLDKEFTRQIEFLFSTVQAIESQLCTEISPGKIHLSIYTPTRAINQDKFCLHHTFISWRVQLLSSSSLPSLFSIRCLTVVAPDQVFYSNGPTPALRRIDHRILLDLANLLPNLDILQCMVGGDEWHGSFENPGLRHITRDCAGPRRDSRHNFRKALDTLSVPSLRHVDLDFLYPLDHVRQIDQRRILPNLVKPAAFDPLSTSLRLISYQLRSMKICVVADETLFWPTEGYGSTPAWPNLERINVMFHMSTPSGSWYFEGLPGVGATEGFEITSDMYPPLTTTAEDLDDDGYAVDENWDDEHRTVQFRVSPNEKLLIPFLTAFARAAGQMPRLESAELWSPLDLDLSRLEYEYEGFDTTQVPSFSDGTLGWGVAYRKPGVEAFDILPGEDFCPSRQIWWRMARWRPPPELQSLFRRIGKEEYGEGLLEYWGADQCDRGLPYYREFDTFAAISLPPSVDLFQHGGDQCDAIR
ncbi:hypothetical protein DPSP01_001051 [Paraphaeosphaeria sporulosa]|uniref:F-box domain-containing protein n=1 Tax=Paraphaeosphaeria sporulosa TaxID=1460663 RepID=A0A177C388_9PLEO|nr:uncharacterized protein CC84DRAFT_1252182 [Paraphaeosphaeria sporulosa]OAG02083.1 hypothetical protein CC84DRAFT_1252182 [Paraphaeosphaeria sporulosa]